MREIIACTSILLAVVAVAFYLFHQTPEEVAAGRNYDLVRTCVRAHGDPKTDDKGILLGCDYNHKHGFDLKLKKD